MILENITYPIELIGNIPGHTYMSFKIIGLTWRGKSENKIKCFILSSGGLVDVKHFEEIYEENT